MRFIFVLKEVVWIWMSIMILCGGVMGDDGKSKTTSPQDISERIRKRTSYTNGEPYRVIIHAEPWTLIIYREGNAWLEYGANVVGSTEDGVFDFQKVCEIVTNPNSWDENSFVIVDIGEDRRKLKVEIFTNLVNKVVERNRDNKWLMELMKKSPVHVDKRKMLREEFEKRQREFEEERKRREEEYERLERMGGEEYVKEMAKRDMACGVLNDFRGSGRGEVFERVISLLETNSADNLTDDIGLIALSYVDKDTDSGQIMRLYSAIERHEPMKFWLEDNTTMGLEKLGLWKKMLEEVYESAGGDDMLLFVMKGKGVIKMYSKICDEKPGPMIDVSKELSKFVMREAGKLLKSYPELAVEKKLRRLSEGDFGVLREERVERGER